MNQGRDFKESKEIIGNENDEEEATDTGEKNNTNEDYHEGHNESHGGNDCEDDEDNDKDDSDVLCTTRYLYH